jgi:hypothetical protein
MLHMVDKKNKHDVKFVLAIYIYIYMYSKRKRMVKGTKYILYIFIYRERDACMVSLAIIYVLSVCNTV